jgi:hypothetical protein
MPKGLKAWFVAGHENSLELPNIGVHRYKIFGKVAVHHASEAMIPIRFLKKSHAEPPDDTAEALAPSNFWIDNFSHVVGAYNTRHSYRAEFRSTHTSTNTAPKAQVENFCCSLPGSALALASTDWSPLSCNNLP